MSEFKTSLDYSVKVCPKAKQSKAHRIKTKKQSNNNKTEQKSKGDANSF